MKNGYRDDLLLDSDDHSEDGVCATPSKTDKIDDIIEETKREIQSIFEGKRASKVTDDA